MNSNTHCKILVVDGDTTIAALLKDILEKADMHVLVTHDVHQAIELLDNQRIDVILSDISGNGLTGFDLLAHSIDTDSTIKVILMSDCASYETVKRALNQNAFDYLSKPFADHETVIASVNRAYENSQLARENIALLEQLKESNTQMTAANKRLLQLNKQLRKLAVTDGLTQLYNRRYVDDWLQNYAFSHSEVDASYSIILLDIDHFKAINDSLGHDGGDKVLKHLAKILSDSSRDEDLVGRYGGEEFIVVMPDTDEEDALLAAERVRTLIEKAEITVSSGTARTSTSIGVSTNLTSDSKSSFPLTTAEAFFSGRALIAQADKALYAAKDNGRNQTVHYNRLPLKQDGAGVSASSQPRRG